MPTFPALSILRHPATPLAISGITLLIAGLGYQYMHTHPADQAMNALFVFQVLVIAGAIAEGYLVRRVPFRESLRAAGGWRANQGAILLALLPAALIAIFFFAIVARLVGDENLRPAYHSAHWHERQGHYFAQYDNNPEKEISKQEYQQRLSHLNEIFSSGWLLISLMMVGASATAWLWPGRRELLPTPAAIGPTAKAPLTARRLNPFVSIFRSEPVRIPIAGVGSAAIERLRQTTPRFALFKSGCVGSVSETSIVLRRYRGFRQNGMAPVLYAKLEGGIQGSAVVGEFRMSRYTRVFMCFWFGFLGLFSLVSLVLAFSTSADVTLVVGPIVMMAIGVGMVWFGQMDWDEDCRFIEAHVRQFVGSV